MTFETRMTRQFMPTAAAFGGVHTNGATMVELIPPDEFGDWRFREMMILPTPVTDPGYSVPCSTAQGMPGYSVPSKTQPQPNEVILIWEKYKESE